MFQKRTLKQYEEHLLEKRRDLEKQKAKERIVTLDKDLKSMQLVGKKKEDSLVINQVGNANLYFLPLALCDYFVTLR